MVDKISIINRGVVNFGPWLKWFLIFLLSILGFVVYYSTGLFWKVHEADITYICHLITIVYFYFSVKVGKDTYNVCIDICIDIYGSNKELENYLDGDGEGFYEDKERCRFWYYKLKKYYRYSDMGWFVANHLPQLGLLGTLIGMAYVFLFSDLNMATKAGQLIAFKGMGTALYTTIAGSIFSLILKIQLFNLKYLKDEKTGKTNGV